MGKTIKYRNADIIVTDEVADFLEKDRKRLSAQRRSDKRHLNNLDDFELVMKTSYKPEITDIVCDLVQRKLTLEKLYSAINSLSPDEKQLIQLYFYNEKTMEEVGALMGGVSKMAISKRLKKLLSKMRNLMGT